MNKSESIKLIHSFSDSILKVKGTGLYGYSFLAGELELVLSESLKNKQKAIKLLNPKTMTQTHLTALQLLYEFDEVVTLSEARTEDFKYCRELLQNAVDLAVLTETTEEVYYAPDTLTQSLINYCIACMVPLESTKVTEQ